MAGETGRLDQAEHRAEIEITLAGHQMLFVAVAETIGQPHLRHPVERRGRDPVGDPLGHQVGVIGSEGEREGGRADPVVIVAPLLHRVREVVDLRLRRLLVQVLQQQPRAPRFGMGDHALQPVQPGLHPLRNVGREVIPGVHHDPLGAKLWREVNIGAQIRVHRLSHQGRVFRDVARRAGV